MIISVTSGKGGTGKTSVAVNLALSVSNVRLLDCDVEEPNAHLLLHPEIQNEEPVCASIPRVDRRLCDTCGQCARFCQYNAIFMAPEKTLVFPELCHSCGGCALVCPKKAITWEKQKIGTLNFGATDGINLVYGELEVSKPLSVPIIRAVKSQIKSGENIIFDSPPGTSCPFVETVSGSDFCLLVTEPTPFGLHDLKMAVEVLRKVEIPFGVVINRAGIGDQKVYDYCRKEGCGVCKAVCPVGAVTLISRVSGKAFISKTKYGFMSHALLNPGESNSGKLVTLVRQNARIMAQKENCDLIIIDGSPGIGCPVIASITGVDAALVVTEPTFSGIHDLHRVLKLLDHFNVTPFVCINMYDINASNTNQILTFCKEEAIEVVVVLPFSPDVTQAMINGKTIFEYSPENGVAQEIRNMWNKLWTYIGYEES